MNDNDTQEMKIIGHDEEEEEKEVEQLMQCLPIKASFMGCPNVHLIEYQNFWYQRNSRMIKNNIKCQRHLQARDSDLFIASHPKTGTTWLITLLFAVVNRVNHSVTESPILSKHPHELVNRLEDLHTLDAVISDQFRLSYLDQLQSPRLLTTHFPYVSLPETIKNNSKSRILYICRNPLDTLVSQWYFYTKVAKNLGGEPDNLKPYSLEDYFEDWVDGKILYGPFFEHVIDYWMQSLQKPEKVLFLKYEDLKDDPVLSLKRIANFVGMPFSDEEESCGVITKIINMCDIDSMKALAVNKDGMNSFGVDKKIYFRKGMVGEWTNYFSPTMYERIIKMMEQKLEGTGLTFKLLPD